MTVAVYEKLENDGFELQLGYKIQRWVLEVGRCRPSDTYSVTGDKIDAFAPKSASDIHELYQARLQK